MKKVLYLILLACLVCSCKIADVDKPNVHDHLQKLTSSDMNGSLSADTITPPSNPLAPRQENTYTVAGVLVVSYTNYPAVETLNHPMFYQLLDQYKVNMRFDDPILQGLTIGDTIGVTGELYKYNNAYFIIPSEIAVISPFKEVQW